MREKKSAFNKTCLPFQQLSVDSKHFGEKQLWFEMSPTWKARSTLSYKDQRIFCLYCASLKLTLTRTRGKDRSSKATPSMVFNFKHVKNRARRVDRTTERKQIRMKICEILGMGRAQ